MLSRFCAMAAAALIASACSVAAPPPGIPDGWSDGFVYANGIRIHYYHAVPAPGKPVIVMVHGVTDNGLCWTTLTWKLQDDFDVYMVDARGHGLSDPFMPGDTGDTLIKDLVGFVHAMKFEKPILLGHSMGAATVMRVGAEYPDLAKAIIMLDPLLGPMPGRPAGRPGSAPPWRPSPSDPLGISMVAPPEILVKQNNYSYEALVAKARRENPKWGLVDCEYWALSKKQYHGPYADAEWQAMTGTMRTDEALAKITAPALILKADAPPEAREAIRKQAGVMQHGKLVFIDGAAHNLHHDQLLRTVDELHKFLATLMPAPASWSRPFYLGADVTFLDTPPLAGSRMGPLPPYQENGTPSDEVTLLRRHGWKVFRVRVFVSPVRKAPPNTLEAAVPLARHIKEIGGTFLLDLHFSDTWSDPQHQEIPVAWRKLDIDGLANAWEQHAYDVVKRLREAGATPDWVQIGNEITRGTAWPIAQLRVPGSKDYLPPEPYDEAKQWSNLIRLLKAGIRGVDAAAGPHPPRIAIHIDRGADWPVTKWFFDHLDQGGVKYDIIAQSFYPEWKHGTIAQVQENLRECEKRYGKDFLIVETGYGPSHRPNNPDMLWPLTPEGRLQYLVDLVKAVKAEPDGLGVLYWAPEIQLWNRDGTPQPGVFVLDHLR